MTSPILETQHDKALEGEAIRRILETAAPETSAVSLPALSAIDYLLVKDQQVTAGVEIKTRKETVEQIRSYGGLMLKHRKLVEMAALSEMLRARCFVAFCFENSQGPILLAEPSRLTDLPPVTPPPRRNFRGLPCDEEPVVYLDWDTHLVRLT